MYKKKGSRRLLFYRKRQKSPRIHDVQLRKKVISLIEEVPTRTVSKLKMLLREDENYRLLIETISDRTIYRFLGENGMSQKERYRMLTNTGRKAYHAFEAPFSMALARLEYGVNYEDILLLTGSLGSGKSLTLKSFIHSLDIKPPHFPQTAKLLFFKTVPELSKKPVIIIDDSQELKDSAQIQIRN